MYKKICLAGTYKAKSVRVAEGAKVIENTQKRDINIALVNRFSQICTKMNINTYDVLQLLKRNEFLNFKPGLVGGLYWNRSLLFSI